MKLNLLMASDDILAGYRNLDPYPVTQNKEQEFSTNKETAQVDNLDAICDDAECEEIIASDVLDFIHSNVKFTVLDNWIKKLGHNGILVIGGTDLYEAAKAVVRQQFTFDELQLLIYGHPQFPFGERRGLLTIEYIINYLTSKGLIITNKVLDNCRYTVTCKRP